MTAAARAVLQVLEGSPLRCATVTSVRCALTADPDAFSRAVRELVTAGLVSRGRAHGAAVLVLVAPGVSP